MDPTGLIIAQGLSLETASYVVVLNGLQPVQPE